jgi:molybdopterin-guanine dinucleotide biosynthesis protein A
LANINQQIVVTNQHKIYEHYQIPTVSDLRQDCGPLAGIESALEYYSRDNEKRTKPEAVLFLPCDLPKLEYTEIIALCNEFTNSKSDVVFAETIDQKTHPLCAVVSLSTHGKISAALNRGTKKITLMWNELNGKKVVFTRTEAFVNINNLEDLKKYKLLSSNYHILEQN